MYNILSNSNSNNFDTNNDDYDDDELSDLNVGNVSFSLWCDPEGDGACLYRCFSVFLRNTQHYWYEYKRKILYEASTRYPNICDIFMENDETIQSYVLRLKQEGAYADSACIWIFCLMYELDVYVCDYRIEDDEIVSTSPYDTFWVLYNHEMARASLNKDRDSKRAHKHVNTTTTTLPSTLKIQQRRSIFLLRTTYPTEHYQILKPRHETFYMQSRQVTLSKIW